MENPSIISIIIPTYNAVKFIQETVECCLQQTYQHIEVIIQDDCSNDGTWELLQTLYSNQPRVGLYRNEKNLGIGRNWNAAYEKVTGDYVVIFNADDLFDRDFLQFSLSYFEKYEVDLVISPYYRSDESQSQIEALATLAKQNAGILYDIIGYSHNPGVRIHWNYTLARRKSIDKLKNKNGLFYPTQVCDSMLWMEAFRQKLVGYYTGEIKGMYRIHDTNNSRIPLGEFESTYLYMLPLYRKELNLIYPNSFSARIKSISKYVYLVLKYKRKINRKIITNILFNS